MENENLHVMEVRKGGDKNSATYTSSEGIF